MTALMGRLRVYSPNGAALGSLPHPLAWEAATPLNDMSSLTVTYPRGGAGVSLLNSPVEVALELMNPRTGNYTEHPGCRFLSLRRGEDLQARPGVMSLTMPSYGWMLRKIRFTRAASLNKEFRRPFTNASPGTIMKAFLDEAHARGNSTGLAYDFTATADSSGRAWNQAITAEYDFGQDAWSALDALSRQGVVDWRINGRTLQVYVVDTTLGRDLSDDSGIILHPHAGHIEEPSDRTLEDLASSVLVVGDEGAWALMNSASALSPWGNWEEVYQASGVRHVATLQALGNRAVQMREQPRIEYTKQLLWQQGAPVPFVDYRPGDTVRARADNGSQVEPMRVHQITLRQADTGPVTVALTLNDRFSERGLRNERWLNRMSGLGGPGAGGGTGGEVTPKPPTPEPTGRLREPAAPTNLSVGTQTTLNPEGEPVGRAQGTWEPVTHGVDGEVIEVQRYQFVALRTDLPSGLEVLSSVDHPLTTGFVAPLDGGYDYRFRVRAFSTWGWPGPWSAPVVLNVGLSDVPPPEPSIPVVSSKLGTVRVEWNGLTHQGESMPLDFTELHVEISETGGSPWRRIGEIFTAGSAVIATGQPVGELRWFRFIARNSSGLFSPASPTRSIRVAGVEGPDIAANSITANHVVAGTLTSEHISAYSLKVDRLSVGSQSNMVSDPSFSNPELTAHRVAVARAISEARSLWGVNSTGSIYLLKNNEGDSIFNYFPILNNTLISLPSNAPATLTDPAAAIPVQRPGANLAGGSIMARFLVASIGGSRMWPHEGYVELVAEYYNRNGQRIARHGIVGGQLIPQDDTRWMASASGSTPPTNAAYMIPQLYAEFPFAAAPDAVFAFESLEIWQESSVYIGDGRITAPLIQANAIDTAKLSADAITAKHTITGSFIRTSPSGQRVTLGPNANFLGQPGVRIWATDDSNTSANIFVADTAGSGGWEAGAFAIVGPERIRNNTGRADFSMEIGGAFHIRKKFVDGNTRQAGLTAASTTAEVQLDGTYPRGNELNDAWGMARGASAPWQNGSFTWGFDNGWLYRAIPAPRNGAANPGTPRTTSIYAASSAGFSWVTSGSVTRIEFLCFRGGYVY